MLAGMWHTGHWQQAVSAFSTSPPAGMAPEFAQDGKTYTSILYGNGPGYIFSAGDRPNVTEAISSECCRGLGEGADGTEGKPPSTD